MKKEDKKVLAIEDFQKAVKNLKNAGVILDDVDPNSFYEYYDDNFHRSAEGKLSDIYWNKLRAGSRNPEYTDFLKKITSKKNLSPEEIREMVGASLRFSLGPEMLKKKQDDMAAQFKLGRPRPIRDEDLFPILESVPVDKNRRLTIRKDSSGNIYYTAERIPEESESLKKINEKIDLFSENHLSRSPILLNSATKDALSPEEIAYMKLDPTGHIGYINSGKRGIAEGAIPRLVLESASRGQVPHSSNLLVPGQKFTERMAEDFKKPDFIDKIKKYMDTGKLGKVWSVAAPIAKVGGKVGLPLAAAYSNYSEASEMGLPKPVAGAYALAEEANPLPISGIDYYKGIEKAAEGRAKNIAENYRNPEEIVENESLKNYGNSAAARDKAYGTLRELLNGYMLDENVPKKKIKKSYFNPETGDYEYDYE